MKFRDILVEDKDLAHEVLTSHGLKKGHDGRYSGDSSMIRVHKDLTRAGWKRYSSSNDDAHYKRDGGHEIHFMINGKYLSADLNEEMKFRDIVETPALMGDYDSNKMDPRDYRPLDARWRHVSTTDSGHTIHRLDMPNHDLHTRVVFRAVAPDNRLDLHVSGKVFKSKPDEYHVSDLAAFQGNTLKAHDFYHHIVHNHFTMVSDGAQSEGGKKTWERLAQKPDIAMHTRPPALVPGAGGGKTYATDAQTGDKPVHPSAMKDYYVSRDPHDDHPRSDEESRRRYTRFVARPMKMAEAFKIEPYVPDTDHLYVAHGNVGGHRVRVDFSKEDDVKRDYSAMFRVYDRNGIPASSRGVVDDRAKSVHIAHAVAGTVKDFVATHRPKVLRFSPHDDDIDVRDKKAEMYGKLAKHLARNFGGKDEHDPESGTHRITFAESLAVQLAETITDWTEKRDGMMVGQTMVGPHRVSMEFVPSHLGHYSASFSVNHNTSRKNFTGPDPVHSLAIAHTVASSMDNFVTQKRPASVRMLAWDNDPDVQMKKVSKYGKLANYLADRHKGVVDMTHDSVMHVPVHTVHFPEHE